MLNDYLGEPTFVIGIGNIYPVRICEIEEFRALSSKYIVFGKTTFKNRLKIDVEYLLDFYIKQVVGDEEKLIEFILEFSRLLEITLKNKIEFIPKENKEYGFRVKGTSFEVNKYNFDIYREVIMKQNLLYEPLTEENDLMQEWLDLARETRAKNAEEVDIESICQLVSIVKRINPSELRNYTYYQVMADASRISLIDSQQYIMLLRSQGVDEPIPVTSKVIDLYRNPEEALIKKENSRASDSI